VRPEPGSNSPRKFVAHFETDEIKNLICAPQFGDRTALRFDFIAEVCISLVVQFSKIKFFLVSASTFCFSSNSYTIPCSFELCKNFFFVLFLYIRSAH
ncbi:hypothetical protein, partial [Paenibacillus dendrobii]|uniref:hypothetical protein n=1 Tax=Paenibacillus dendrobii TaxID=2691084 RepID=UPI001F238E11